MTLERPLVLVGMMVSGKSSVAEFLGREHGLRLMPLDGRIVARAGKEIADIFEADGEEAFRDLEAAALAEAVGAGAEPAVVDTGGGVVDRPANRRALTGSDTDRCFLDVAADVLADRLGDPSSRPMLAGGDPAARLREIAARRGPLYREVATYVVEVGRGEGVAETARRVLGGLAR